MAIALRGTGTTGAGSHTGAGGIITWTKPTGVVANDVIVLFVNFVDVTGSSTIPTPTGFSVVGTNTVFNTHNTAAIFIKLATGAEGSTFTSTTSGGSGAQTWTWDVVAYSGCDTTTQQDATATAQTNTAITGLVSPSITSVTNGAQILTLYAYAGPNALTAPTSPVMTSQAATTGVTDSTAICDYNQSTAGATGTLTATSTSPGASRCTTIALRPAVVAGPTGTFLQLFYP